MRSALREPQVVRIGYLDGYGVLRNVQTLCTSRGWKVLDLQVEREDTDADEQRTAVVAVQLQGKQPVADLVNDLTELDGVLHASAADSADSGI